MYKNEEFAKTKTTMTKTNQHKNNAWFVFLNLNLLKSTHYIIVSAFQQI